MWNAVIAIRCKESGLISCMERVCAYCLNAMPARQVPVAVVPSHLIVPSRKRIVSMASVIVSTRNLHDILGRGPGSSHTVRHQLAGHGALGKNSQSGNSLSLVQAPKDKR